MGPRVRGEMPTCTQNTEYSFKIIYFILIYFKIYYFESMDSLSLSINLLEF